MSIKKKFKDIFGKENMQSIVLRLRDLFEEEDAGFVIIYTAKGEKVTDAYFNICKNCVMDRVIHMLNDAEKKGLLRESAKKH